MGKDSSSKGPDRGIFPTQTVHADDVEKKYSINRIGKMCSMFAINMSTYERGESWRLASKSVNMISELAVCSTRDNESLNPKLRCSIRVMRGRSRETEISGYIWEGRNEKPG